MCKRAILQSILVLYLAAQSADAQDDEKNRNFAIERRGEQKWALLIGVDNYLAANDLDFCGRDVSGLRDRLVAAGFPSDHVVLLHDEAKDRRHLPFMSNIEVQLDLLLGSIDDEGKRQQRGLASEGDLVVVAFSGHGVHLDGDSYFCPTDARLDKSGSLLSLERLYRQLSACPADVKLLLVDACRNDPRPGGTKSVKATEGAKQFARSLQSPPQGLLVLSSCAPGQVSIEDSDFSHGVFMKFVLDGLAGEADRDRGDGNDRVSLLELYRFCHERTKTYVARKRSIPQTPTLRGELIGDFEFGRIGPPPLLPQLTNSIGMKLVMIPSGEFLMGSSLSAEEIAQRFDSKAKYFEREHPQHPVQITKPFYLQTTEVTQGQWRSVMGTEPWKGEAYIREGANYAATYVSWEDAVEFCRKLSAKEGVTYRLPTEAEWEYACRAGSTRMYSFGDEENRLGDYAWFHENARDVDEKYAHRVGQKRANPWGLYGMHGNVYEWCNDWYDADYYESSPRTNPQGPLSGSFRVFRGGSWYAIPASCRSAFRYRDSPDDRDYGLGFRVLRSSVK